MYHYFSGTLDGGIREMVETVNKERQGERVVANALNHEAFKSMIVETLQKGNPPELFTYWAGAKTQELVNQGMLEPLDDIWPSVSSHFPKSIVDAASTYNSQTYLLPITQHLVVFFYNKTLFAENNLSPPSTWSEFLELCQILKDQGIPANALGAKERWPAQFWFDYLLLRTAGPQYRLELMQGKAAYDDPEVTEAYRIWSEMLLKGYFNEDANELDWAEATELVCNGEAAMTLMGTWAIQHFLGCKFEEGKDFDYFIFPAINTNIAAGALGPIDGIVLSRDSANHEFAKTVLSYFAEPTPQKLMSAGSGALSPSLEIPADFYTPLKQRLFHEIKKTPFWAFNYDLATSPLIAEKGMDSFNELIMFPDQYREILQNLQMEIAQIVNDPMSN
jgi:multiple sugar transport system substrate-binding protein/raffinose/stachyose/melibiose transport system substrate-binding protein